MHTNLYLLSTRYDIQVIRMMIIITLVCINKAEFKVNLKWHSQPILLSYNYVFLRTFNEKKKKWGARLEFIHQELTACWNISVQNQNGAFAVHCGGLPPSWKNNIQKQRLNYLAGWPMWCFWSKMHWLITQ